MSIKKATRSDLDHITNLALKLWPDNTWDILRPEFEELMEAEDNIVYIAEVDGACAGFIHMSIRYDYVEGSNSSPVGYIEAIYIDEKYRNRGIARELIRTGEQWAKSLGCTELASDAELDNVDSHDFHKKIGFHEAGRIVSFIKEIDNASPTQLQEWNGLSRNQAEEIIKTYFQSWIEKNFEQFISVVHDEAIVRECTGAVIEGRAELHRWFKEWNDSGNQVVFWKIHTIGYDKERTSAYVEWTFNCIFEEQEYEWDGCSIVYFRDSLIVELNEYEMKREKFHPYQNKLQKWDVKL